MTRKFLLIRSFCYSKYKTTVFTSRFLFYSLLISKSFGRNIQRNKENCSWHEICLMKKVRVAYSRQQFDICLFKRLNNKENVKKRLPVLVKIFFLHVKTYGLKPTALFLSFLLKNILTQFSPMFHFYITWSQNTWRFQGV